MNSIKQIGERALNAQKVQIFCSKFNLILSWAAVAIIGFGLLAVLSNYIFFAFQPFRGPSRSYFWLFLFASLLSSRLAIWLIIFSLPLMPNFHIQLEFITHPAVKYFFAHNGVDAITGLFIGMQVKYWWGKRRFASLFHLPSWQFGLLLVVLTCSTALAISRDLRQSASVFSFADLTQNILNIKLIPKTSDYMPLMDLVTISMGVLLIIIISQRLKDAFDKNSLIFKPLVVSLFISACWGVIQALSSFGLKADTTNIRPDSFGFGALGFQPDIHAFGGLMIVGAAGLTGFISSTSSKHWRYASIGTSAFCWLALFLSKSRASLGLAIIMAIVLTLLWLSRNKQRRLSAYCILIVGIFGLWYYFTSSMLTVQLYEDYLNNRSLFFEKVNLLSSWRFDLQAAALRMWSHFPFMGIGQGNLYRASTAYDFSGSALMVRLGGENAHNYFLQTLAEVGGVGFLCYLLILILPLFLVKLRNRIIPAYIAISALFLGNVYSHSFIIRENYLLLMALIGLLYAHALSENVFIHENGIRSQHSNRIPIKIVVFIISGTILLLAFREIARSDNLIPFEYGRECYRASKSEGTGWAGGRFALDVPPNSHGVKMTLHDNRQHTRAASLPLRFYLFDNYKNSITGEFQTYSEGENIVLKIVLPNDNVIGSEGGVAILSIVECIDEDYEKPGGTRHIGIDIIKTQIF